MRQAREWVTTRGFALGATAACGMLAAVPAAAIEFRAAQHVVVAADEVIADDVYATGETVTVEGKIEGDLVASGREVRMQGELTGDLVACGQAVVVDGPVGDDIRMAGMALRLGPAAAIGDDVVAAGLSLETDPESLTRGSLLFAGFQALLAGEIAESLHGSMHGLELQGGIGGDSEVEVGGDPDTPSFVHFIPSPVSLPEVPGGLTIADSARIGGRLEYTSPQEARGAGAGSGALSRREPSPADGQTRETSRKSPWPGRLFRLLGLVVLGLLLARWAPGWLRERSGEIQSKLWPIAGVGLLGVTALPVGIALALVVLVVIAMLLGFLQLGTLAALVMALGLAGLGLLVLSFWVTATYLAPLLVGLCTGRWVVRRMAADRAGGLVLPLVAGLLLLALLRLVPLVGFLVTLAVLLLGWGVILWWLWRRSRPDGPAAIQPVAG